ncbi:hypothetical protein FKP32DRAFT_1673039 [Trametes sanguinea]|nr:hypothetical protein FKP32DRAFT_1673039 [Trametes sanguinea]
MKRLSPASLQYAVIQMDPAAMVQHYADADATAAAQKLRPKKYLVYLNSAYDLPFPTSAWFRHQVDLVGPSRRRTEPKRGITSDMVIPIHPNADCLPGRSAINTEPEFPFHNCYHWIDCSATVRVRRKDDLYDDTAGVKVNARQHVAMSKVFFEDYARIDAFKAAQGGTDADDCEGWNHEDVSNADPPEEAKCHDSLHLNFARSFTHSPSLGSVPTSEQPDDLYGLDVFGLTRDDDAEFLPLVHLWFELTEHFTADSIPDPMEFFQEQETIANIIRGARRRNPHARLPPRNGELELDSDMSDEEDGDGSVWSEDGGAHPHSGALLIERGKGDLSRSTSDTNLLFGRTSCSPREGSSLVDFHAKLVRSQH